MMANHHFWLCMIVCYGYRLGIAMGILLNIEVYSCKNHLQMGNCPLSNLMTRGSLSLQKDRFSKLLLNSEKLLFYLFGGYYKWLFILGKWLHWGKLENRCGFHPGFPFGTWSTHDGFSPTSTMLNQQQQIYQTCFLRGCFFELGEGII